MRSGNRPPPARPAAIDLAAAILVFGGLFGYGQLVAGEYVVTGSLPAKDPIVGVALVAYAASVVLGIVIRMGRGWLAALNFAAVVAILYLPAVGRPVILVLVVAHLMAVAILLVNRRWFADMAEWRRSPFDLDGSKMPSPSPTVSRGRARRRR
jgi:Mn2+/Fe2+ NRAMP family transporter